jgi:hypothetical protein
MEAIREKMYWLNIRTVFAQQDGASSHNGKGNEELFAQEAEDGLYNVAMATQPAQSPDLNTLELGFFNSLKAIVNSLKEDCDRKCGCSSAASVRGLSRRNNESYLGSPACLLS